MRRMNIYEAAVFLRISPRLIKWFTKYAPKQGESKKLVFELGEDGEMCFDEQDLREFNRYLADPWPHEKSKRPSIPAGIETEIKFESSYSCVICAKRSGHLAHIDPVHNSKNNHPHNLIHLCPNHHDDYDIKKIIAESEIRSIKKDILDTQVSIWRSHVNLLDTVFLLINELKLVREKIKSSESLVYIAMEDQLLKTIKKKVNSSVYIKDNPVKSSKFIDVYNSDNKADKLIKERDAFLVDDNLNDCPLCEGSGVHNNWECSVCRGVGTVDIEVVNEIDLSPFKQDDCPLCEGSGDHNNRECPVCRGVGTVDIEVANEIDLSQFKQEDCPLCKGSGEHNNRECPVCRGVGTVDIEVANEIDLSQFKQEDCPLCKGSGDHNNRECPVCRGVGTVDIEIANEIDISEFE